MLLVEPSTYQGDVLNRQPKRPTQLIAVTLPYLAALAPPWAEVDLAYDVCTDLEADFDLASYDVVGITVQTFQMKRAIEIARLARAAGAKVLMGGPATIEDEGSLVLVLSRFADVLVVGEADEIFGDVLDDLRNDRAKRVYHADEIATLEGLPVPRFDLVDFSQIEAPHILPSITARGCPRRCTFCNEFLYGKWRNRPVDEVTHELLEYRDSFNIPRIVFRDDDFLVFPKRSKELLASLVDEGLEWGCQTDLNLARHEDVIDIALRSGMRAVSFGLESVRETNRTLTDKLFFTIPEAEDILLRLHEEGVETQVNIIFGFDDDTPEVFDETLAFVERTKVSRFFASVLFPIPGTPLHDQLKAEGRLIDERSPGISGPLRVGFVPKHMDADQLLAGYADVLERFDALDRSDRSYWLGPDMVVI